VTAPTAALAALGARATAFGRGALVAFAFYTAALELGRGAGLIEAITSFPGLLLLAAGGLGLLAGAAGALASGPTASRVVAAAIRGGAALAVLAVPASLLLRDTRQRVVVEGETIPPGELPGLSGVGFGAVRIAPRGPHLLSKTVQLEARQGGGAPVTVGTFPPARVGPWALSVFRFGYAPAIRWTAPDGRASGGLVPLGTMPNDEEEASLVEWSPEPNVMMGAGTFPPKREDLVPVGAGCHVFLRIAEARVGGVVRDLRAPEAYRWLADGRLEDVAFDVLVLRGRERVFSGTVRAGARVETPIGTLELAPDVAIWVELLATRDPFLPWAVAGLALLALGLCVRLAGVVRCVVRGGPPAPASAAGEGPRAG
jgi:hypothetical protein